MMKKRGLLLRLIAGGICFATAGLASAVPVAWTDWMVVTRR